MREALLKIVVTNKYIVTTKFSNLQYSGSSDDDDKPEYSRFENLVVAIYLLVTTILNKASRNFIYRCINNGKNIV